MGADLLAHLAAWWPQRQVHRASTLAATASALGLAACAWRIRVDGSTVPVSDLAGGHRHLLVPLVLVVVSAAGLAGSVASWNGAAGWSAVVAVTGRSTHQGWFVQALVAAVGAATWAVAVGAAGTVAATGVIAAVGGGPTIAASEVLDLAVLVARVGLTAGGLGALAGATGLVLPGRALPAVVVPVLVLGGEVVGLVVTRGSVDLVGGAALSIVLAGAGQGRTLGLDASETAWLCALVWLVLPLASLGAVAVVERTKGIG